MRGIRTVRVARRLTHEPPEIGEFAFQPYTDVRVDDRTALCVPQILKDYADACLELSRQITLRWLEHDTDNVLLNRRCLMKCKDYLDSSVKKSQPLPAIQRQKLLWSQFSNREMDILFQTPASIATWI
ncbi:hypothetical protein RRG08_007168 [Elysia crispata]|uniref:Uncharacterized protein n=1 Tax=Elysia crispata TaxID=231223 RepID=A0AAE1D0J6_9GAST|nr:hypothetical protein RRG08_007168 [Elysia crispata]